MASAIRSTSSCPSVSRAIGGPPSATPHRAFALHCSLTSERSEPVIPSVALDGSSTPATVSASTKLACRRGRHGLAQYGHHSP